MRILWFAGVQLLAVMGKEFNCIVEGMGCLRLSTKERYTRHIGNTLDEDYKKGGEGVDWNG